MMSSHFESLSQFHENMHIFQQQTSYNGAKYEETNSWQQPIKIRKLTVKVFLHFVFHEEIQFRRSLSNKQQ